ncbi:hypothetical protein EHV15_17700 [Paenibacillus oralis]|uniref:Endopolygalacturonase n=2 Tax=Paenibacillus oralis TaxID=2490856 RepID=A0A3P3UBU9_9BACL|nr:hypothetical protein EHV15_17700 [Paenibacillus oralis]
MHEVRDASMVMFDCAGTVELEVSYHRRPVVSAVVRPLSNGLHCEIGGRRISLTLDGPRLLSLEVNGDRFHNLHIFANPIDTGHEAVSGGEVLVVQPGLHRTADILSRLDGLNTAAGKRTVVFGPGLHRLDESRLPIPSHTSVYIAGGAVVYGGLICDHVEDVAIRGRGILYMSEFEKTTYYRGVEVTFSRNILIEGITVIDPPHYTVLLGQSEHIRIRGLKTFSARGWCDGIDMMACRHVEIAGGFLRTSDDCVAVYASRGEFQGDTRDVAVSGSILWADVAHPINIGTHGNYESEGDVIEKLIFSDIDMLEHHEPQPEYWGCMAINAGDNNTVRDVTFEDIRIESFELGELFNLRVLQNKKYNPVPGKRIEQVRFKNIHFNGSCNYPSHIAGYDESRTVRNITFEQITVNGKPFELKEPYIIIGKHVHDVKALGDDTGNFYDDNNPRYP